MRQSIGLLYSRPHTLCTIMTMHCFDKEDSGGISDPQGNDNLSRCRSRSTFLRLRPYSQPLGEAATRQSLGEPACRSGGLARYACLVSRAASPYGAATSLFLDSLFRPQFQDVLRHTVLEEMFLEQNTFSELRLLAAPYSPDADPQGVSTQLRRSRIATKRKIEESFS